MSSNSADTTSSTPSDEELRKLLKPNPSNEDILQLVPEFFPDATQVKIFKELESYDDRNYWIKVDNGVDYLVKVHNGVESKNAKKAMDGGKQDSVIHFQYALMKALLADKDMNDSGISASCPIFAPGKNEALTIQSLPVVSASHTPADLVVSVYQWVPGIPMANLNVLPVECLADAGRLLGKVKQQWELFLQLEDLPAAQRYHQWDGKNTSDLRNWVQYIQSEERRAMIESIITAFETELIKSGVAETLRKGMNHGDFNDANILMDDSFKVTGVIDFGDAVESWVVLDASVAMAYAMLSTYGKSGRSLSAAAAFLRGFHMTYPLTETERKCLVLLVCCRLACSVTLGAYSFKQNPKNKYLLLHAEPAWTALEFLWGLETEGASARRQEIAKATNQLFDKACSCAVVNEKDVIDCGDLTLHDSYLLELCDSPALVGGAGNKKRKSSS